MERRSSIGRPISVEGLGAWVIVGAKYPTSKVSSAFRLHNV